jgi:hypothetical protein
MFVSEMRGPMGQQSELPAQIIPPAAVSQIKRLMTEVPATPGAGKFVPAAAPPDFWIKHKDKVFIGGAVAAGALIIWLIAR